MVGTLLFVINQLDVVLRGDATTAMWVKSPVTYLVPFGVANARPDLSRCLGPYGMSPPSSPGRMLVAVPLRTRNV